MHQQNKKNSTIIFLLTYTGHHLISDWNHSYSLGLSNSSFMHLYFENVNSYIIQILGDRCQFADSNRECLSGGSSYHSQGCLMFSLVIFKFSKTRASHPGQCQSYTVKCLLINSLYLLSEHLSSIFTRFYNSIYISNYLALTIWPVPFTLSL